MIGLSEVPERPLEDIWKTTFVDELMARVNEAKSSKTKYAAASLSGAEDDFEHARTVCGLIIDRILARARDEIVPGSQKPMVHEFVPAKDGKPSQHRFYIEFEAVA